MSTSGLREARLALERFVHNAVFCNQANAETAKEGYAVRTLNNERLRELMDDLQRAALTEAAAIYAVSEAERAGIDVGPLIREAKRRGRS